MNGSSSPERCKCPWCGNEIYVGNLVYAGALGLFHRECIVPQLAERLGVAYLAALCGYREEIA